MKGRHVVIAGVASALGIVGLVVGWMTRPDRTMDAYLTLYSTTVTVAIGGLILLMVGHATHARWFILLRRPTQAVSATLPWLALLFVPIAVRTRRLYPWAMSRSALSRPLREAVEQKHRWLNDTGFIVRAVLYFVVLIVVQELIRAWGRRNDASPDPRNLELQRVWSGGAFPAVGLVGTFASFDWMMSLEPEWHSTIYGAYVLIGGFSGACGAVAMIAYAWRKLEMLPDALHADHFHALGRVMLTAVMCWAYFAFSQFLLIWIADMPTEVSWYEIRVFRSWGTLGVAVLFAHFVIPFALLLSRSLKRNPAAIAVVGAWLVVVHILDVYWIVMPAFEPWGIRVHWTDVAALLAIGGTTYLFGAWRAATVRSVPRSDPHMAEALRYESP